LSRILGYNADSKSKRVWLLGSLALMLLWGIFFAYILIENNSIREIESQRDLRLAPYEIMKFWVYEDVRSFLLIGSESDYNKVYANVRFSDDLKYRLLGSSYSSLRFGYVKDISLLDAQYTLGDTEGIYFYFLLKAKTLDQEGYLDVIAFVRDDKIVNLIIY